MLVFTKPFRSKTAPLVGGLAVVALGAIALALPPAPIGMADAEPGVGLLQATALFSDGVAEQSARNGFGHIALDISQASADEEAFWRKQVELVAARRFPVWGWVDLANASGDAASLVASLTLSGVYLYGEDAVARAAALRVERSDLEVVAVLPAGSKGAREHAMVVDFETYLDTNPGEYALPVLVGDQLTVAEIREAHDYARKLAGEDGEPKLLIARIPLPVSN